MSVEITRGAVAEIIIDDPRTRNALGIEVIAELADAIDELSACPATRVLVLAGSSSTFSSGANIKEVAPVESVINSVSRLFNSIRSSPKPVVARVEGVCLGLAVGLVAACDLVLAARDTRFALPEPHMGQAATLAAVTFVPRVRRSDAAHYLMTGDAFDGDTGRDIGLVSSCVDTADLGTAQENLCRSLIRGGPEAIAASKRLVNAVSNSDRDTAFAYASVLTRALESSDEATEGATARAERRYPNWSSG